MERHLVKNSKIQSAVTILTVFLCACLTRSNVSTRGDGKDGDGEGNGDGGYTLIIPDGGSQATDGGLLGNGDAITCGQQTFPLTSKPADLLLVLDRSRSMLSTIPGSENNKWQDMTIALDATLTATDGKILWGLKTFPNPYGCDVADPLEVDIKLENHDPIMSVILAGANDTDYTGTPTAKAMKTAVTDLNALGGDASKYILLATDGQPNCKNNEPGEDDDTGAIASVEAAFTAGYKTFVIGIAIDSGSVETLNAMAEAGKMARSSDPKYYPVESKEDLVNALSQITSAVASCTFHLTSAPPVPENVAVQLLSKANGNTRVLKDASNGWSYGSGDFLTVVLKGSACAQYKTSDSIEMIFGCPGKVID
jgi:hypothetical protein